MLIIFSSLTSRLCFIILSLSLSCVLLFVIRLHWLWHKSLHHTLTCSIVQLLGGAQTGVRSRQNGSLRFFS